jgi:nucleoside-diphosphate-sugar epimerase
VGWFIHAANIDGKKLGPRRNLAMPSVSVTVAEQIEALKRVAGEKVAARIKRVPDPVTAAIVTDWAEQVEAKRARELGFEVEKTFDDIIRVHIEDELGGKIAN